MRRSSSEKRLTERKEEGILPVVGETEAGNAGERPARDNRLGRRAFTLGVYTRYSPSLSLAAADAQSAPMPLKTPGSGAEPPGHRDREGSGWSGVSYRREAFVHFTLNQDMARAGV